CTEPARGKTYNAEKCHRQRRQEPRPFHFLNPPSDGDGEETRVACSGNGQNVGMLQVRELSVEVAGRTVVAGASFNLRAGDKVGLVGRNGAGKTSLLEVLAGGRQPAGGVVLRRGRLGHVTQDARPQAAAAGVTAVTRILSG